MRLEFDEKILDDILNRYDEKSILIAQKRSISRIASKVVTQISREIRKNYNIKAKDIKKHIKTHKGVDSLVVEIDEKNIPLVAFAKNRSVYQNTIPIVEVQKGKRTRLPYMFYAVMNSGHMGLFMRARAMKKRGFVYGSTSYKRVGHNREELAINEMVALDAVDMVKKSKVEKVILDTFKENFQSEVVRQLSRVL